MTNIQVGDRVRVRKGECLGHEGYVRSVGTSDGTCTAYVSIWAKHGWLASPALPFDWLERVLDKSSGNLFKVGDVVKSLTHDGWDEGLVVNVYDAHDGLRHRHCIVTRHNRRNGATSPGETNWDEGAVAFVRHVPTAMPSCGVGDRVQLFGDDRQGIVKEVTADGLIRLDCDRDGYLRPGWKVYAVIQRAAPAQDPLVALTKLPRTFSCCACRNSFQQQAMEFIKADGDTWGTCKECFRFLWTAGVEKKQAKRDVMRVYRKPLIDRLTFSGHYGNLLHEVEVGRNFVLCRGDWRLAFEVTVIDDTRQVQFFRSGNVPFGDPQTTGDAADKVFTFLTDGTLEECWSANEPMRVGALTLYSVEDGASTFWVLAHDEADACAINNRGIPKAVKAVSRATAERLEYSEGPGAPCSMREAAERLGKRGHVACSDF